MNLLGTKWTDGNIDFEIITVEKINGLEHFEQMYRGAFDIRCAKMHIEEKAHEHTEDCVQFFFCEVKTTDKSVIAQKKLTIEELAVLEEPLYCENIDYYKADIYHLLTNKSRCFNFTAVNQVYPNNKEEREVAFEQYKKLIAVLGSATEDVEQGKKRVVQKNGTVVIEDKTEQEIIAERIAVLKQQLDITRDMVIDNQECIHCEVECIHDPQELHRERQALRDEVNQLEMQL